MHRPPELCTTMGELRIEIDRLDQALVDLLVERSRYIDQAAVIKSRIDLPARIDARVEEVVANVLSHAEGTGLPQDLLESFWRGLIEWSIAREDETLQPGAAKASQG